MVGRFSNCLIWLSRSPVHLPVPAPPRSLSPTGHPGEDETVAGPGIGSMFGREAERPGRGIGSDTEHPVGEVEQ